MNDEYLDRLRTIVDEACGMQPVLDFDELLSLVEKKLGDDHRGLELLRSAVLDLHVLMPPERVALMRPRTREAIAMVLGSDTSGKDLESQEKMNEG